MKDKKQKTDAILAVILAVEANLRDFEDHPPAPGELAYQADMLEQAAKEYRELFVHGTGTGRPDQEKP